MTEESLSISNPHPKGTDAIQKAGLLIAVLGVLILFISWFGVDIPQNSLLLFIALSSIFSGTLIYSIRTYLKIPEGIKNNGVWFNPLINRGLWGWIAGIILTGFYIELYWFPELLGLGAKGEQNNGLVFIFDPLSQIFTGKPATQWFVYGTIYTIVILSLGVKFIFKYRHNRYQIIRTIVVMISQLFLAYLIPEILEGLNSDKAYFAKDLKYFWPLNYYFFEDWH